MLVTNGKQTRNISDKQLPEYTAKGYAEVKEAKTEKPKAKATKATK